MEMPQKIQILMRFFAKTIEKTETVPKQGRPYVYSQLGMLLFFIVMHLKRIYKFKAMAKYVQYRYEWFGFATPPSRKTIRRRFLQMPGFIRWLLPCIAREVSQMQEGFSLRIGFVDKSVFKALGGIWHKKHRQQGIVPHPSIDTDASWGKSAYHGWRFGYGLHLIVNHLRFPLAACATTAAAPDKEQVGRLLNGLLPNLLLLVGDAGYRAIRFLQQLWRSMQVFLLTYRPFTTSSTAKRWYNQCIDRPEAQAIYRNRKPSVEPAFSLIKELFALQGQTQLPYRGLAKVRAFLLITVATVQLMMVFNLIFNNNLGDTEYFKAYML